MHCGSASSPRCPPALALNPRRTRRCHCGAAPVADGASLGGGGAADSPPRLTFTAGGCAPRAACVWWVGGHGPDGACVVRGGERRVEGGLPLIHFFSFCRAHLSVIASPVGWGRPQPPQRGQGRLWSAGQRDGGGRRLFCASSPPERKTSGGGSFEEPRPHALITTASAADIDPVHPSGTSTKAAAVLPPTDIHPSGKAVCQRRGRP